MTEKMKTSHVLYKVNDLQVAVEHFEAEGFTVEYGKKKNPYNALIYFSEGPHIELIENTGVPVFFKGLLRLFFKGKTVDRFNEWDQADEGLIGLCLENYRDELNAEKAILKKYGQKYFALSGSRTDTKDRKLKMKGAFPDDMLIPFLMTYFSIDPKPKHYIHPNGVVGVKSISFGTKQEYIPLINELCDDDRLKLFVGEGVKDLELIHQEEGVNVSLRRIS